MSDPLVQTLLVIGLIVVVGSLLTEVVILSRAYRVDSSVIALRERVIASSCRLVGVTLWATLLFHRIFIDVLPTSVTQALAVLGIFILAIPAFRFIWLYLHHGFH